MTDAAPIALVTGAARGLGTAIAAGLTARGHVVWHGVRDPAAAPAGARAVTLDVDDPASIAAAMATIDAEHGRLDVLVNNAAINLDLDDDAAPLPLGVVDGDGFARTLRTNVVGVYATTVAALPLLRRAAPDARVVNLTTGLAATDALADPTSRGATRRLFAYTSSKAAVDALTLLLAHELRDDGIAVVTADPGFVATDMNKHAGTLSLAEGAEPVLAAALATSRST
jgi:NAD(P)-dependent dehydrogenase (short-subunit alcohol dehydrogenase family)